MSEETPARPECTIKKFGEIPITQKLYYCKTCKMSPVETVCEECAKFCHQAHDLTCIGYKLGYCHCGYGCSRCHCFLQNPVDGDTEIPPTKSRQCDFRESGTRHHSMDMFKCEQCNITGSRLACYACHHMCHHGHRGSAPNGHSSSAYCDCGDPSQNFPCKLLPPLEIKPPIPLCTYSVTGKDFASQISYNCTTCNLGPNVTLCESCAKICHAGHDLVQTSYDRCYCDCGAGGTPCKCKIMEDIEPAQ